MSRHAFFDLSELSEASVRGRRELAVVSGTIGMPGGGGGISLARQHFLNLRGFAEFPTALAAERLGGIAGRERDALQGIDSVALAQGRAGVGVRRGGALNGVAHEGSSFAGRARLQSRVFVDQRE